MRIVWSLLGLLAVFIIAAFVYASTLIDKAIETGGSKVLGVPVTLDMAKLEPFSGKLWLKGLTVANPEKYETEQAFSVDEVYVSLDLSTLLDDAIVINEIAIRAPKTTFEGDYAQNNFSDLYKNIQQATASEDVAMEETAQVSATEVVDEHAGHDHAAHPHKKVIVDNFVFEKGIVTAVLNTPVGQKSVERTLPDIRMTGLGRDTGGLTPEQLLEKTTGPIQKEIQRVAHGAMDELKGVLQNGVDTFKSRVKSLADDVKSLF